MPREILGQLIFLKNDEYITNVVYDAPKDRVEIVVASDHFEPVVEGAYLPDYGYVVYKDTESDYI